MRCIFDQAPLAEDDKARRNGAGEGSSYPNGHGHV